MEKKGKYFSFFCIGILFFFLLFLSPLTSFSEDTATQHLVLKVSEICLVDISGNPGNMEVKSPALPGLKPDPIVDSSTFIHYTSTVSHGGIRDLTAKWGHGSSPPSGCEFFLKAIPSGKSNEGISRGKIKLSEIPQSIVTGIKSCVTGKDSGKGTQLEYILSVEDITHLVAGESKTVSVIFTLTDST